MVIAESEIGLDQEKEVERREPLEHVVFELPRIVSLSLEDNFAGINDLVWVVRGEEGEALGFSAYPDGALSTVERLGRARRITDAWIAFRDIEG